MGTTEFNLILDDKSYQWIAALRLQGQNKTMNKVFPIVYQQFEGLINPTTSI